MQVSDLGKQAIGHFDSVKQTNNRRGLLQWLNLRGIGGLKTGKDQDEQAKRGGLSLPKIYAP